MGVLNKWKQMISKRCKSLKTRNPNNLSKCKSCPEAAWPPGSPEERRQRVAPGGCFSVYVGPEKRRFVMKAKDANHPLFQRLLEDAEQEYGYKSEGPLELPCDVGLFCKVLAEIDCDNTDVIRSPVCGGYVSYSLLSPSRLIKLNNF